MEENISGSSMMSRIPKKIDEIIPGLDFDDFPEDNEEDDPLVLPLSLTHKMRSNPDITSSGAQNISNFGHSEEHKSADGLLSEFEPIYEVPPFVGAHPNPHPPPFHPHHYHTRHIAGPSMYDNVSPVGLVPAPPPAPGSMPVSTSMSVVGQATGIGTRIQLGQQHGNINVVGHGQNQLQFSDDDLVAWQRNQRRVNLGIRSFLKGVMKALPARIRYDKEGKRIHNERQRRAMASTIEEEKRKLESQQAAEQRRDEQARRKEARRWERHQQKEAARIRRDEQRRIDFEAGFRHSSEDEQDFGDSDSSEEVGETLQFGVRLGRKVSAIMAPILPAYVRVDREGRRIYKEREAKAKLMRKERRQRQRERDKRYKERVKEREERRIQKAAAKEQARKERERKRQEDQLNRIANGQSVDGVERDDDDDRLSDEIFHDDSDSSLERSSDSLDEYTGYRAAISEMTSFLPLPLRYDREGRRLRQERTKTRKQAERDRARRARNRQRERSLRLLKKEKLRREKLRAASRANEIAEKKRQVRGVMCRIIYIFAILYNY